MRGVRIELEQGRAFTPGAVLSGRASWRLLDMPVTMVVRLFWRTSGRGNSDLRIVDERRLEKPGTEGELPFQFTLPTEPYSVSGKLISLIWAVEAVAEATDDSAHQEFVMAPHGQEVVLEAIEDPE
jgi:hypothetical protein